MSAEQLQFYYPQNDTCMNVKKDRDKIKIELMTADAYAHYTLDRNQADMLRLYLTEHLK